MKIYIAISGALALYVGGAWCGVSLYRAIDARPSVHPDRYEAHELTRFVATLQRECRLTKKLYRAPCYAPRTID